MKEPSRDGGIKNMSHTHSNLIVHIVFATQGRLPLIKPEMKIELFAYMGALLKEKQAKPIIINGMPDHAHILTGLPPTIHVSDTMKFVKANSSRWMKERFNIPFAWQRGFGAFSVSRSNVDAVAQYIRDQEAHHAKFDFEKEYVRLLDKNGVDYEPNYLWK